MRHPWEETRQEKGTGEADAEPYRGDKGAKKRCAAKDRQKDSGEAGYMEE